MRKTKIVCTLGPASTSLRVVQKLARAGMNVARFNASHETHAAHAQRMELVRRVNREENRHLALLLDTQGPKIRTGTFAGGSATLREGARVHLTSRLVEGTAERFSIPLRGLEKFVEKRGRIVLADGGLELSVEGFEGKEVVARVVSGGIVTDRKTVTLPGVHLPLPPLTPKDKADIKFAVAQKVDFIAQSFVRRAADIAALRRLVPSRTQIVAKIEDLEALHNLDEIIAAADAVVVARGDLGLQVPIEEVPIVQKRIIAACNKTGKPVIVATQMLESMINSPVPTRAEVTDVANAVLDGADGVWLSGETAMGQYPVAAVRVMDRVASKAEQLLPPFSERDDGKGDEALALARAACKLAADLKAGAVVTPTSSGSTARRVARCRPQAKIVALTPTAEVARALALCWGVHPLLFNKRVSDASVITQAVRAVKEKGLLANGELAVVTAGIPLGSHGSTNTIKIERA